MPTTSPRKTSGAMSESILLPSITEAPPNSRAQRPGSTSHKLIGVRGLSHQGELADRIPHPTRALRAPLLPQGEKEGSKSRYRASRSSVG